MKQKYTQAKSTAIHAKLSNTMDYMQISFRCWQTVQSAFYPNAIPLLQSGLDFCSYLRSQMAWKHQICTTRNYYEWNNGIHSVL